LYPGPDRDPTAFLEALSHLRRQGRLPTSLRVTLRATGFDSLYRSTIDRLGLTDTVALAPPLSYKDAIRELLDADGLLIFQGRTSNPAIPAKAYEYLRSGRPILAMVDPEGETAKLFRDSATGTLARLDDRNEIEAAISLFLAGISSSSLRTLSRDETEKFSRMSQVKRFAELFNSILPDSKAP
jgi:hypothetical protein